MVTSGLKEFSRLWNSFQISSTVTRKVGHSCHRASTSTQDRYLALSAWQFRQTTFSLFVTLLLCLEVFPCKQTIAVFAVTGLYTRCRVWILIDFCGNRTHSCSKALLSSLMINEAGLQAAIERPRSPCVFDGIKFRIH
ncbi:hypothetical protein TNCV_1085881 [Trichonephila clavipes]|nr:hypothetical protein TNCV_1085881 [Trichonephila clavipes]